MKRFDRVVLAELRRLGPKAMPPTRIATELNRSWDEVHHALANLHQDGHVEWFKNGLFRAKEKP